MWLYLGILSTATIVAAWYLKKVPSPMLATRHTYTVTIEICKVIRRNGLGICLLWTRQVIANQIGRRLVEMHPRYYVIHYPFGVTWYKIIVPRRKGPCLIDTVSDGDGKDVKKDVRAFMGPSHNFHGMTVTPKMLGYDSLIFTYIGGKTKIFAELDEITI